MPYILPPNFRRRGPMLGAHFARHIVRRGMRGLAQDATDVTDTSYMTPAPAEAYDPSYVPVAPNIVENISPTGAVSVSAQNITDSGIVSNPLAISTDVLPLAPAALTQAAAAGAAPYTPSNPLYYATPALAIAAGLPAAQVNSAFAAQTPLGLGISSSTLTLLGVSAVALLLLGATGKKRR